MVILTKGESGARVQPPRGWPRPGPSPIIHTSTDFYLASHAYREGLPSTGDHSAYGAGLYTLSLRNQAGEPGTSTAGQPGIEKTWMP